MVRFDVTDRAGSVFEMGYEASSQISSEKAKAS